MGTRPQCVQTNRSAHFHKCTFSYTIEQSHSFTCSYALKIFSRKPDALHPEEGPPATVGTGDPQRVVGVRSAGIWNSSLRISESQVPISSPFCPPLTGTSVDLSSSLALCVVSARFGFAEISKRTDTLHTSTEGRAPVPGTRHAGASRVSLKPAFYLLPLPWETFHWRSAVFTC